VKKAFLLYLLCALVVGETAKGEGIPPAPSGAVAPKYGYAPIRRDPSMMKPTNPLGVGFEGVSDVILAKVSYSTSNAIGLGFGIALPVSYRFSPRLKATAIVNYQIVTLTRSMQESGAVVEPISSVTQSVKYLGLGLMGSYLVTRPVDRSSAGLWSTTIWVEVGAIHLRPVSATQTNTSSSGSSSFSYASPDHPLYALAGAAIVFKMTDTLNLMTRFHLQYNVFASAGSQAFGLKSSAGVELTL
jgi:hypothetical protein